MLGCWCAYLGDYPVSIGGLVAKEWHGQDRLRMVNCLQSTQCHVLQVL